MTISPWLANPKLAEFERQVLHEISRHGEYLYHGDLSYARLMAILQTHDRREVAEWARAFAKRCELLVTIDDQQAVWFVADLLRLSPKLPSMRSDKA